MHRLAVMAVDVGQHMPAVAVETFRRIVGEPAFDATIDRNTVVVVERDELAQSERCCERARLVRDALHHAAVAEEHVRVVIDDVEAFAVEFRGEQLLRDREPDGV